MALDRHFCFASSALQGTWWVTAVVEKEETGDERKSGSLALRLSLGVKALRRAKVLGPSLSSYSSKPDSHVQDGATMSYF